jgi:drug/metabolite transporter (DMT)-like permease
VSIPAYLFLRFLVALPIVAIAFRRTVVEWLHNTFQSDIPTGLSSLKSHIIPGGFLVLAIVLQALGMREASPGVSAFLTSLVFLFVPIFEMFNRRGDRLRHVGLLLLPALAGTFLLTQPGVPHSAYAVSCLLGGAACYAGQIFFSSRPAKFTHPAVAFLIQGTVVTAAAGVWLAIVGTRAWPTSVSMVLSIAYVAIVVTAACYLVQFWAQRFVRPRYVSLIYAIEPVAAMALSFVLHREILTTAKLTGAFLLIGAALVAIYTASNDQESREVVDVGDEANASA